ncbi:MAG TPA: phospholipase D-like domain-containing protein [Bacteroidales bacterium]|nr:phospholipase D-like domain-containing protein [Bacteroidales bacterium]HRZ47850.1 phospholipase D-like domain-containing protein [Bacteroidales bacterium]
MKNILFSTALLVLSFYSLNAQNPVPIAVARQAAVNDTVTIAGVVLNGSELGVIRYIQDPTGGLAIYDGTKTYLQRGDSVKLTGIMDNYNQLLELRNVYNDTVLSSNNPLPAPVVITPSQFGEIHESVMIRINDAIFTSAGGTFAGNTNYTVTAQGQQAQIRINNGNPLVGGLIPTSQVDLVGIGSQFSYSNPAAGYQMLLRNAQDIISNTAIALTSPVSVSNITGTGFDLTWTTNINGSTQVFYGNSSALGSHQMNTGTGTSHTITLAGLSPGTITWVKAFSVAGTDTAFSGVNVYATRSLSSGDIKVYFTSTVDNSVSTGVNAMQMDDLLDDTLIAYIDRADSTIDLAIYNFGAQNISAIYAALNQAYNRGVKVRVVHDGTTQNQGINSLLPAIGKIASPASSEYGIMHNKFMIFDANHSNPLKPIVWTGSMNWTETCVNQYANNVVIIQDQSLAKAYTLEFEEMFGSTGAQPDSGNAKFGPYKTNNTPHEFIIGGKRVKSFFSPSDGVNGQIISHIQGAQNQVYVSTMLITRSDIAYALRDQKTAGRDVKVIVNDQGECTQLVVDELKAALGAQFREFGESYILHNKLMIIDPGYPGADPLVWTGSHNWSNAADQRNDENTLVIHDDTIANIYLQEFTQRYALGVPLSITSSHASKIQPVIFPNPSDGNFNIMLPSGLSTPADIMMFSSDGKLVYRRETVPAGSTVSIQPDLKPGVYLIRVLAGNTVINSKLVIR